MKVWINIYLRHNIETYETFKYLQNEVVKVLI